MLNSRPPTDADGIVSLDPTLGTLRAFTGNRRILSGRVTYERPTMGTEKSSRVFDFYPLEDRVLLSGEGLDGAEGAPEPDAELAASLMAEMSADGQAPTNDPSDQQDPSHFADQSDLPAFDPALPVEVVFVDSGVNDAQTLLDGLRDGGEEETQWLVFELASDQDGVEQITRTLSQLDSVDAIHIVSHGDGEGIQLGDTRLDMDFASGRAGEIAAWGASLDTDADLLIYGCDLASTDEGRTLIDSIAALCDCDVAASDDDTGHEDLGGDWILEYAVGDVTTDVAFGFAAQSSWYGTLDITSNLVAHYELEESSGSTAQDSTANNNDGSWVNGPTFSTDSAVGNRFLRFWAGWKWQQRSHQCSG